MTDYSDMINSAESLADVTGAAVPDMAWLYLEDSYYWPNPHYKGEPVCNPAAGPDCTDGQQFNPKFGLSLREKYELRNKDA